MIIAVAEDIGPHRGHRGRDRRSLGGDEPHQRLGLEELTRHEQRRPRQERGVRHAPGVRMELRDDRQHTITGIQPHDRRGAGRDRVQVRRAMRVDDALGVARRAARVTHGRRGGLIRFRVVEAGRLSGDELVVAVHGAARGDQRRRVAVADDDPRLDRRAAPPPPAR